MARRQPPDPVPDEGKVAVWPKSATPYVIPDTGERVTGDEYRAWKAQGRRARSADYYRSLMTDPTPTDPPADAAAEKE